MLQNTSGNIVLRKLGGVPTIFGLNVTKKNITIFAIHAYFTTFCHKLCNSNLRCSFLAVM